MNIHFVGFHIWRSVAGSFFCGRFGGQLRIVGEGGVGDGVRSLIVFKTDFVIGLFVLTLLFFRFIIEF